ncbi:MDR family MFS transporter [Polluticoccus soli]|uniref:MDR family MFS transporter n=1 Tax=Polluticoccus soli TaxID=3034150 RepID=UPI0023E119F0|nr:MFS transporter [Flavipsychrobacter sp. JY13-12]
MKRVLDLYKNAYSGLSPSTWLLCIVMLVNRSGTMVFPFMSLYLTQSLGFTIGDAGWVIAIWGVGSICGGFIGGKLTDKIGFYYIQMFTLLGGGLMFLLLGQMHSYSAICITTFLLSIVNESFRPANAAAIAHYSKEENRTRSYSLNRLSINLGWAVGGALGGFIAGKSYELLFWIDGFTNIGAALLLWFFLAPSKNKASAHAPTVKLADVQSAYKDKAYLTFIVLTMLYAYCFFQLFSTMPVFYKKELHLPESYIGIVMAANGILIALFEMVLVHNLEGKRSNLHYITRGTMLLSASFLVFNILPGAELLAISSMLLCTMGEIFSMPFMNSYWISRASNHNRGQYAGLYTIAWATAQVLGPATGAQIAEHAGFNALWWIIGAIGIGTALGFKWLQMRSVTTPMVSTEMKG